MPGGGRACQTLSDELLGRWLRRLRASAPPPLSRVAKSSCAGTLSSIRDLGSSGAARVRREVKTQRLTLPDIIERIDDGRPGAEAWWAAVSDSTEAKTLVRRSATEEMQEALSAAP